MTTHPIDQDIQKVRLLPAVRAIVIPPCPESLVRLQSILAAPELDAGAIDQLASSDVAMAAALIRQANSPLYALAQPVQTVGMALTVLGLRPAVELLSAFITRHALQVRSPLLEHFWESSQRRAIACEHIHNAGLFCNAQKAQPQRERAKQQHHHLHRELGHGKQRLDHGRKHLGLAAQKPLRQC